MDTTKVAKLTAVKGSITSWENGPTEHAPGYSAQVQLHHEARHTAEHNTRADALRALAAKLEAAAAELRAMAESVGAADAA